MQRITQQRIKLLGLSNGRGGSLALSVTQLYVALRDSETARTAFQQNPERCE